MNMWMIFLLLFVVVDFILLGDEKCSPKNNHIYSVHEFDIDFCFVSVEFILFQQQHNFTECTTISLRCVSLIVLHHTRRVVTIESDFGLVKQAHFILFIVSTVSTCG